MFKCLQVIKRYGRISLDLFHKRGDISLILKGQFQLCSAYHISIEIELEPEIVDVILLLIIDHANVLRIFPVLNDHAPAVSTRADILLLELPLDLGESLTRPIAGDQGVSRFKPDAD